MNRRTFVSTAFLVGFAAWRVNGLAREEPLPLNKAIPTDEVIKTLKDTIPGSLARHAVPGLSVALIRNNTIAWTAGFGVRDTETKEKAAADTVYDAASLTKPTFGYYVLRLCEQDVLGLDTPLTRYRKEPFIPDEPRLERITARTVLAHTSALPIPGPPPIRLRGEPGKEFFYSATGFNYLQSVIDRLTGKGIAEYLGDNVLNPFGMRASSLEWRPEYERTAAVGYDDHGKPGLTLNGRWRGMTPDERAKMIKGQPDLIMPTAASSMYTTAPDFARFLCEIIRPIRRTSHHLSAKTTDQMLSPQVKIMKGVDWGIGWGLEETEAGSAFWHWGDAGVYQHFAVAHRKSGTGVVILTNSGNGLKACKDVVSVAMGGQHPAFAKLGV